jgi:hypothetical protein
MQATRHPPTRNELWLRCDNAREPVLRLYHRQPGHEPVAGKIYVLAASLSRESKAAVIKLRQKLVYSYPDTLFLLAGTGRLWLKGTRRQLENAQQLLAIEGITTQI